MRADGSKVSRPDVGRILGTLKDFQRDTVEYVFRRLYTDPNPTRRFLIADEVGLGKTFVARGLIALAVDHLWDKVERIDVVYICSNADIARQNINRLNIGTGDQGGFELASRITLLPTTVSDLQANRLNLISLTPATSFGLTRSLGTAEERALLYWLLDEAWDLRGTGPLNVFQGNAGKERFRDRVHSFKHNRRIDPTLTARFIQALNRRRTYGAGSDRPDLRSRFDDLCQRFRYSRAHVPEKDAKDRAQLVGELRTLLAATCLRALEPDIVILDEFQRFKYLLTGEDEASQLARELFEYSDEVSSARVLLLSATPYKMYTITDETSGDDHYEDFLNTVSFLLQDQDKTANLKSLLEQYRHQLYHLGVDGDAAVGRAREVKESIEGILRGVMVRTERLAVTEDRDGMLVQVPEGATELHVRDLEAYISLQDIAELLEQGDMIEYWKSAPYLLNFMDEYEFKRAFEDALHVPSQQAAMAEVLSKSESLLLPWSAWASYSEIDPGNARLRQLFKDVLDTGAWRLLWIPPSLPYYRLGGPFSDPQLAKFTKRLVFSAWRVVPKVLAILLSYEAERRMIRSFERNPKNSPEARRRRRPLLRFSSEDGRLTGMPVLGLMYPSITLAREIDPMRAAGQIILEQEGSAGLPSLTDVLVRVQRRIRELMSEISMECVRTGPEDESWYWAAPILLDLQFDAEGTKDWFSYPDLARAWSVEDSGEGGDGEDSQWGAHVDRARELLERRIALGRQPDDLPLVLALMAVASPGTCVLRSLLRVTGSASAFTRDLAAQVAWGFRTLFNAPEVMALVRSLNRQEPYWRRILEYCADGCLQSTLDEYAHFLRESLGVVDQSPEEASHAICTAMYNAITLRTAVLGVDEVIIDPTKNAVSMEPRRVRARFALRYGDDRTDTDETRTRPDQVRRTFNSPFWPFVLTTTSVGQEGLDFHAYCHAVVHWNLPSNPVDLEQREGRVHRYKGHAIRKNVALKYGKAALVNAACEQETETGCSGDPWEYMFAAAERDRDPASSDLVPYWVYPVDNGARIERCVPALPLSRERSRLDALRRSLAVYRMVFGQPRQEDLLTYLLDRLPEADVALALNELQIDLAPPKVVEMPK